jgi:hypothetical protein
MNETACKQCYLSWCVQVDSRIQELCGLGLDDLPDCLYRDWYDDGGKPGQSRHGER